MAVVYEGPERETMARCDGPQMRQVVWNLVRNAIQASSAGSTVTVRVEPRERDVTLAVDDQGQGIPETVALRIFDEFFTTRTHGAGIGLAVVRRILQDHASMGAKLAVQRAPGGGASFQVTLNRDVERPAQELPAPLQQQRELSCCNSLEITSEIELARPGLDTSASGRAWPRPLAQPLHPISQAGT